MKIKNVSAKVIGFGTVDILPNEVKEIDKSFETNPIIKTYEDMGFIKVSRCAKAEAPVEETKAEAKKETKTESK